MTTELHNAETFRAASIRENTPGVWLVFFGSLYRGEFIPSRKSERTYKTFKSAERAAAKWTA